VRRHRSKARVDDPSLAYPHLIDGGLHVVVNAPPGNAAESPKRPRMGIKEHLVTLGRIR